MLTLILSSVVGLLGPTGLYAALAGVFATVAGGLFVFRDAIKMIFSKPALIVLGPLLIVGALVYGIHYVATIQRHSIEMAQQVVKEQIRAELAEETGKELLRQAADQASRLKALEEARAAADDENSRLRNDIRNMNLKETFRHDPKQGASDLARRTRELNRMLERTSERAAPTRRN